MIKIRASSTVAIGLSTLLVSCNSGGGGNSKLEATAGDKFIQYSQSSCDFKFDQGQIAFSKGQSLVKTHFGKSFVEGGLDAVMAASPASLVEYARATGVQFYRNDKKLESACDSMAPLSLAPYDLSDAFDKAGEGVLGVYLHKNSSSLPSTNDVAGIVVRLDVNKWVLTHEFMHHLFKVAAVRSGMPVDMNESTKSDFKEFGKAEESYANSNTYNEVERLNKYVFAGQNAVRSIIGLAKSYSLEEMAIETILGKKFDSGEFELVLEGMKINGAQYIVTSYKKADELLRIAESIIISVNSNLWRFHRRDSAFVTFENEIKSIRSEMVNLKSIAEDYYERMERQSGNISGIHASKLTSETSPHFGCSHEKDVDEVIKFMKENSSTR